MNVSNFIKSNKAVNKIISNMMPGADEILKTTGGMHRNNFRSAAKEVNYYTKGLANEIFDGDNLAKAKSALVNSGVSKEYSRSFVKHEPTLQKLVGDDAMSYYKAQRNAIKGVNDAGFNPKSIKGRASNFITDANNYYFGKGVSSSDRNTRIGATVAGVAGVGVTGGVAARYGSGGTMTRNSQGEKDILGIPFI